MYGSVVPLAENSCNYAGRFASSPVLVLPHICSKVRSSPLDICFDSSCLTCVLVLAIFVAKLLFAKMVFASEMALISVTKPGSCGVAPPLARGIPGVVRAAVVACQVQPRVMFLPNRVCNHLHYVLTSKHLK